VVVVVRMRRAALLDVTTSDRCEQAEGDEVFENPHDPGQVHPSYRGEKRDTSAW